MDVVAVGAAEPVVLHLHCFDDARADGLLAVVEVHETKHLAPVIHLGALVFEAPAQGHVPIEQQALLATHRGRGRWIQILETLSMGTGHVGGVGRTGGDPRSGRHVLTHICLCHAGCEIGC